MLMLASVTSNTRCQMASKVMLLGSRWSASRSLPTVRFCAARSAIRLRMSAKSRIWLFITPSSERAGTAARSESGRSRFYRNYAGDCEGARSLGLQIAVCGEPDEAHDDQHADHEQRALHQAHAGELQRHRQQHAGKHMRRRPGERGQNVCGIELSRRHAQNAGDQRHEGAHDRGEAREEHAGRAVTRDEPLAMSDDMRIFVDRPRIEDAVAELLAEPKRHAIAE